MTEGALKKLTTKEQYWLTHIQGAENSNQLLTAYAQAHSLSLKCFYNYRSKLRKKGFFSPKPTKTFVKAIASAQVVSGLGTVILLPNGIRIQTQCQTDALVELVKGLAL
jgi:hypothetical protein